MRNLTFDPWPERYSEALKAANVTPEQYRLVKRLLDADREAEEKDPSSEVRRKRFVSECAPYFGLIPIAVGTEFWKTGLHAPFFTYLLECIARWGIYFFVVVLFAKMYEDWAERANLKEAETKKEKFANFLRGTAVFAVFFLITYVFCTVVNNRR